MYEQSPRDFREENICLLEISISQLALVGPSEFSHVNSSAAFLKKSKHV